jgi:hypothetical protein
MWSSAKTLLPPPVCSAPWFFGSESEKTCISVFATRSLFTNGLTRGDLGLRLRCLVCHEALSPLHSAAPCPGFKHFIHV